MAIFEDPIRALRVQLPVGWTFDPFTSSLTELYFGPWNRIEEALKVSVEPARVSSNQADEIWLAAVKDEVTATQEFLDLPSGSGRAVAAQFQFSNGEIQRVALVRGPRVDFVFEHTGADRNDLDPWGTLRAAVLNVTSAENDNLGEYSGPERIKAATEAALGAAKAGNTTSAFESYRAAVRMATADWLRTLTTFDEAAQFFVAIQIAPILAELSILSRQTVLLLRDAEQIAHRAARSARQIESSSAASQAARVAKAVLTQLESMLRKIIAPDESKPLRRIPALARRAEWLVKAAVDSNQANDLPAAASLACAAIDDLLSLEIQRRRGAAQSSIDASVWAQGEQVWAARFNQVLQVKYRYAMDRQDMDSAEEAATLSLKISALLANASPAPAAIAQTLEATTMIQQAGVLLDLGYDALLDAEKLLNRAETLIGDSPDQSDLRAQLCMNLGWVLFYLKKFPEGLEKVDQGLALAGNAPIGLQCSLHALKAQLLLISGNATGAITEADAAISPAPAPLSTHLLIRALAHHAADQTDDALRDIRQALYTAAADNALGQDMVQILFAASELVESSSQAVSVHLAWSAQSIMDARMLAFTAESKRIAFGDDTRHRDVSETLVSRLFDASDLGAALAAADQTRARSFNQLLSLPERHSRVAPSSPPAITLTPTQDVVMDLDTASAAIRQVADQSQITAGSQPVLSSEEIIALVAATRATALAIQPVGERILLFLVLPEGDMRLVVAESPISTSEVSVALAQLQTEFGILASVRGDLGPPLVDDDDDNALLDGAIRVLSNALIAPVAMALVPGAQLIIVPYRDLALVPFPLLTLPDGTQVVQVHAVSVVPSFGTLALLRQPQQDSSPTHCFVAGDPTTDPKYQLIPLQGAVSEATGVHNALLAAGIPADQIAFCLNEQATETEYRKNARGSRLVHLACHATVREPATQSALFLAPDQHNDGQLYPSEIAMIDLDNAIVFLSACQTGLGHPTADGVLGLSRAFLEAGAHAIVMSMWKVADESTAVLAHYFYQAFLAKGASAADAAHALQWAMLATRSDLAAGKIQTAQREVLDDHPANWAPFLLLGHGGFSLHA